MQVASSTNTGRRQKLQRRRGSELRSDMRRCNIIHAAVNASSVRPRLGQPRAKLGRDQTKSGKIKGNQGLNSGFTTGTPAPEVNLPESSICPSLQRRSALQPDKTRPGHPCTTPHRTEKSSRSPIYSPSQAVSTSSQLITALCFGVLVSPYRRLCKLAFSRNGTHESP